MRAVESFTSHFKTLEKRLLKANDTISFVSALLLLFFVAGDQTYQAHERRFMISEIQMTALTTGLHTGLFKVNENVLNAMARVPRHDFVDYQYMPHAYQNVALPMVSEKYVIPEPFLTAMMIHLMGVREHDRVLEVGYGTGYEAAVLSKIANKVYSIRQTNPLISPLNGVYSDAFVNYRNVKAKDGNGVYGWKDEGPFDAILVKQALKEPPQTLLNQLKPLGRLVVPISYENGEQRIVVYLKLPSGKLETRETLYVKITPLIQGEEI